MVKKMVFMISFALLTFNLVHYIIIAILNHILGDIFVILGALFFLSLLIAIIWAFITEKKGNLKGSGRILFVVAIVTMGTNDLLNILSILHACLGTYLLLKDIRIEKALRTKKI